MITGMAALPTGRDMTAVAALQRGIPVTVYDFGA
jgi:hypothetical protein